MSGDYEVLASRIEQKLDDLRRVGRRATAAVEGARSLPDYQGGFLDSAA